MDQLLEYLHKELTMIKVQDIIDLVNDGHIKPDMPIVIAQGEETKGNTIREINLAMSHGADDLSLGGDVKKVDFNFCNKTIADCVVFYH